MDEGIEAMNSDLGGRLKVECAQSELLADLSWCRVKRAVFRSSIMPYTSCTTSYSTQEPKAAAPHLQRGCEAFHPAVCTGEV